jgi:hypothetical protein
VRVNARTTVFRNERVGLLWLCGGREYHFKQKKFQGNEEFNDRKGFNRARFSSRVQGPESIPIFNKTTHLNQNSERMKIPNKMENKRQRSALGSRRD